MEARDTGECRLCCGIGEVTITPIGEPDSEATSYGCPVCIAAERDEEIATLEHQRDQLLAAAEAAYELLKVIHDETGKVGLQLRAAIAAAKGGAASVESINKPMVWAVFGKDAGPC